MKCALGPKPAEAALKFLYKIPADKPVFEINRRVAKGKSHHVCSWPSLKLRLHVHESNHNVAVWCKKECHSDEKHPDDFAPTSSGSSHVLVHLLHPLDVNRAKEIRMQVLESNCKRQRMGFANFMTSTQLDEYCFDGKYYIA
jgi:hypothetical protein